MTRNNSIHDNADQRPTAAQQSGGKKRGLLAAVIRRVPKALWWKLALLLLAVGVVLYLIGSVKHVVTTTTTTADIVKNEKIDLTPTMIRSIEQIGEWSFLEINDEEIVDTVRHGFFSDDELVRIYYGTLRLGINLKEAHEGWLAMQGDTLRAILPPVRLLDGNFIDETRTRSFIETGKWSHQDRKQMYDRAVARMKQRCLTKPNYATARKNAHVQFEQMLHGMGFDKVKVE